MSERVDILRGMECEAYRIAYYLLEADEPACAAAKRALMSLYREQDLPRLSADVRRRLLRRLVIREAAADAAREEAHPIAY